MSQSRPQPNSNRLPFLDGQFLIYCLVFVGLTSALAVWQIMLHGIEAPVVVIPLLTVAFSVYAWRHFQRPLATLGRIEDVILACRDGNLH